MMSRILLIVLLLFGFSESRLPTCRDENGQPVDWFVVYKLPKLNSDAAGEFLKEGTAYVFMTSDFPHLRLSAESIANPTSLVGRTLEPLYLTEFKDKLLSLAYNDEHPDDKVSMTKGHTKGVVAFDEKAGFWLVHSVPKFPPDPEINGSVYNYPHTGHLYGQTFLCISLETKENVEKLGIQLIYNNPYVYYSNIPKFAETKYPHFVSVAEKDPKKISKAPFFHKTELHSVYGSQSFTSFAKYTDFDRDLYADLVAPDLQVGLFVETWPNGPGKMNSSCSGPFHVENIDTLDIGFKSDHIQFNHTHDHSKWAISTVEKKPYLCIGDINRMETQKIRAGGTVCFIHSQAWEEFYATVQDIEPCPTA